MEVWIFTGLQKVNDKTPVFSFDFKITWSDVWNFAHPLDTPDLGPIGNYLFTHLKEEIPILWKC